MAPPNVTSGDWPRLPATRPLAGALVAVAALLCCSLVLELSAGGPAAPSLDPVSDRPPAAKPASGVARGGASGPGFSAAPAHPTTPPIEWQEDWGAAGLPPPAYLTPIIPTAEDLAVRAAYDAAAALGPAALIRFAADSLLPLPQWRPGPRATPIDCGARGTFYPGHFSIPQGNLLQAFPEKTKAWATVIPGVKRTYVFKQEAAYQQDYVHSVWALTRRRFGFATNRNLEMLTAGAIPYFCGVDRVPRVGTLSSLPMQLIRAIPAGVPGLRVRCDPPKKAAVYPHGPTYNTTIARRLGEKLFDYARRSLPTTHHALYVLSATTLRALPSSVLVVWASHYSIVLTGFVHGLRRLGVDVADVPRRAEVYNSGDCRDPGPSSRMYARGWFFFCRAPESPRAAELRRDVAGRIRRREYDVVVLSITDNLTYHLTDPVAQIPYYRETMENYPRSRVLLMNDADLLRPMHADVAHRQLWRQGLYFKRETHGCDERIY